MNKDIHRESKKGDTILFSISLLNIADFHNSFTDVIKIPPHLKCVATLPCEMLMFANRCIPSGNWKVQLQLARIHLRRYSDGDVDFIWFTDEKVFTVAAPKNAQNNRLQAPAAMKKRDVTAERLLCTRATFCQSLMVSVGVSKLGCTHLIFVDPGEKINGCYYREVLLSQQLLHAMRQVSGDFFVLQQDSAPAHRARETIKLLQRETPAFISPHLWPPNSPDLNPVDYKIWGVMQDRV